ncbi:hypothetical protein MC885_021178, partial [Smutsia gigantea]
MGKAFMHDHSCHIGTPGWVTGLLDALQNHTVPLFLGQGELAVGLQLYSVPEVAQRQTSARNTVANTAFPVVPAASTDQLADAMTAHVQPAVHLPAHFLRHKRGGVASACGCAGALSE